MPLSSRFQIHWFSALEYDTAGRVFWINIRGFAFQAGRVLSLAENFFADRLQLIKKSGG